MSFSTQTALNVVINQRELHGQAVAVMELRAANDASLPAYEAGAHIDVYLPNGIVRAYSLCGDPADTSHYRIGVLREPESRGGSAAVHDLLESGSTIRIGAPRNHFPLSESAPYSVLIGGGIGITPMLAMAWRLHALGKPFELHYCLRHRAQAAFLEELANVPWRANVHLHVSEDGEQARLAPAAMLRAAPQGRHVYVCGPAGLMDCVLEAASDVGLSSREIHREYFSAPVQAVGENAAFELVARRSGKTVVVRADQSLLEALRSIDVQVDVSCEEGVCGTCACTVLDGEPDHRDAYLTDEEREANDQILVCCSRARSTRLVLDV